MTSGAFFLFALIIAAYTTYVIAAILLALLTWHFRERMARAIVDGWTRLFTDPPVDSCDTCRPWTLTAACIACGRVHRLKPVETVSTASVEAARAQGDRDRRIFEAVTGERVRPNGQLVDLATMRPVSRRRM